MAAKWNFRPIPGHPRFAIRHPKGDATNRGIESWPANIANQKRQRTDTPVRHSARPLAGCALRSPASLLTNPVSRRRLLSSERPQSTALQPAKEGGELVAAKSSSKTGASSLRGSSQSRPTSLLDPATIALTAKGIFEAAKSGVDVSVRLYEATRGELAIVGAVLDSRTTTRKRFRLQVLLSSLCPHAIVVNAILLGSPKGAPIDVFLLRPASSRIGWEDDAPRTGLQPPVAGKTALQIAGPFLIPPLRAQEIVVEADRASILSRIYNKRGGTILVSYNVLGDNGDPRELKIEILLRDDQPMPAGLSGPTP
jgi:hypothetical protein